MKRLENFSENTLVELSKWYRIFYNIYISSRGAGSQAERLVLKTE